MSAHPPMLGTWLLQLFGVHESLIGDLSEQHARRCQSRWYWHQVFVAIAFAAVKGLRDHKATVMAFTLLSVPILLLSSVSAYWLSTVLTLWIVVYASAGLGVVLLSLATSR